MKCLTNFIVSLSLTALSPRVSAVTSFTACIDERPWIPYTNPDMENPGLMQILIHNISRDLKARVDIEALPWNRCLESVRSGRIDAVVGASDVPFIRQLAEFPKLSGADSADVLRSLGTARILLVKRTDSTLDWDGTSLAHLSKPVGTAMGTHAMRQAVQTLGGEADDGARTDDQNMRKLLQNRVDLMAGYEHDLKALIHKTYRNKVSILSVPLAESHYFLAFSKSFYKANPGFAESFWTKIPTYSKGARIKDFSRDELISIGRPPFLKALP